MQRMIATRVLTFCGAFAVLCSLTGCRSGNASPPPPDPHSVRGADIVYKLVPSAEKLAVDEATDLPNHAKPGQRCIEFVFYSTEPFAPTADEVGRSLPASDFEKHTGGDWALFTMRRPPTGYGPAEISVQGHCPTDVHRTRGTVVRVSLLTDVNGK